MNFPRLILPTAIVAAVLSIAGCGQATSPTIAQTRAPTEPTALIIADEGGPLSAEAMAIRRPMVVQYLVSRGYISSPDDLVDNPAGASRFIRVVFAPGGGFRITEFTLGNRSRQMLFSGFAPERPGGIGDRAHFGYLDYRSAHPARLHEPIGRNPIPVLQGRSAERADPGIQEGERAGTASAARRAERAAVDPRP
jgi:hypothetical protein